MKRFRRVLLAFMVAVLCVVLAGCSGSGAGSTQSKSESKAQQETQTQTQTQKEQSQKQETKTESSAAAEQTAQIAEDGTYTSRDEVALYIHTYGHLPSNYITKDEAEDAGWKTKGLDLDEACPGKSIGGDKFQNREGKLPKAKGRTWYECDIDYHGGSSRGAKRIVYSSDGLIYYTGDHYNNFEQLYGEGS